MMVFPSSPKMINDDSVLELILNFKTMYNYGSVAIPVINRGSLAIFTSDQLFPPLIEILTESVF
jgi:hypothetical protein